MQQPDIKPYVKGGAIGGALGASLLLVIICVLGVYSGLAESLLFKRVDALSIILIACLNAVPIGGLAIGLIVGFFVWRWAAKIGKNPRPVERALIGVGVLFAFFMFLAGRDLQSVVSGLLCAGVMGISAGLLARSKSTTEASPEAHGD